MTDVEKREHAKPGEVGWLIVECAPQREREAATELRREGLRTYMPQVSTIRIHPRTKAKLIRRRPLMRGYIFARFLDGSYRDLGELYGVKRVVKYPGSDRPFLIRHSVVAGILRAERTLAHEAKDVKVYRMGRRRGLPQTINRAVTEAIIGLAKKGTVVSGPFIDREVEIVGVTDAGKVRANVGMLGTVSVAEFEPLVEIVPLMVA